MSEALHTMCTYCWIFYKPIMCELKSYNILAAELAPNRNFRRQTVAYKFII